VLGHLDATRCHAIRELSKPPDSRIPSPAAVAATALSQLSFVDQGILLRLGPLTTLWRPFLTSV